MERKSLYKKKKASEGKSENATQVWNKVKQRRDFWTYRVIIIVTIEIYSKWLKVFLRN